MKQSKILLVIIAVSVVGFSFSSCKGQNDGITPDECQHVAVIDEAIAATCSTTGLTEGAHCSKCGTVIIEQEVISKLPHKIVFDEPIASTPGRRMRSFSGGTVAI